MSNETYNGWANRETWALMLHINNDQGLQSMFHDVARQALEDGDDVETAVQSQAETVFTPLNYREEFGELPGDVLLAAIQDIGSLWRVDWREVERSILDDISSDDNPPA